MELKLVWYRLKTEFFSLSFDQKIDRYETIDEIIRYDTIKNQNGVVLKRWIPPEWPNKAVAEEADDTDKWADSYSPDEFHPFKIRVSVERGQTFLLKRSFS